jgi:hypothetical protein
MRAAEKVRLSGEIAHFGRLIAELIAADEAIGEEACAEPAALGGACAGMLQSILPSRH